MHVRSEGAVDLSALVHLNLLWWGLPLFGFLVVFLYLRSMTIGHSLTVNFLPKIVVFVYVI